jgi:uncharacterized membrane-anchored protein
MNRFHSPLTTKLLNKVPEVTLIFWLIKILSTTVGETAADYLAVDLNFGLITTSWIMFALLAGFLVYQVSKPRYTAWLYWLNVVLISVVGTLITDNLVDNLGVSLEAATLGFSIALVLTFTAWYLSEHTLAIQTIDTRKRELYYWLAILFTFALGTAAGDLSAEGFGLGYATSLALFAVIIAVIATAHYAFGLNAVVAFWLVYILTRPLGASLGDYLSQAVEDGGLGLGAMTVSIIFLSAITLAVVYLSRQSAKPQISHS